MTPRRKANLFLYWERYKHGPLRQEVEELLEARHTLSDEAYRERIERLLERFAGYLLSEEEPTLN